jgi:hypothetical protein
VPLRPVWVRPPALQTEESVELPVALPVAQAGPRAGRGQLLPALAPVQAEEA